MEGRVYDIDLTPTAVTAAVDLLEIQPADDKPVEILEWEIFQTTDVGDAAEEIIGIQIIRGFTSSGSGGSTPTPRPVNPSATAAGFAAETFNTTLANTGTNVQLGRHGWNVRIPTPKTYTPETTPGASQVNTTIVLRTSAAPVDSITVGGSVKVRELG